jgi:hypothetical protein
VCTYTHFPASPRTSPHRYGLLKPPLTCTYGYPGRSDGHCETGSSPPSDTAQNRVSTYTMVQRWYIRSMTEHTARLEDGTEIDFHFDPATGTWAEMWDCTPPQKGETYRVTEDEWRYGYTLRVIKAWQPTASDDAPA